LDPLGEAYERFGEDFDQEDEVDDYALLHPNSPNATVGENIEGSNTAAMLVSPAHAPTGGAPAEPPRHIRWVSPIVVRSPLGTPPEVPPMKRRRKKGASPLKNSKDKERELPPEEDSMAAQETMLRYWAANPVTRPSSDEGGASTGQSRPHIGKSDIFSYIRDMSTYAKRIDEIGPEATAGLIFHAHKQLQDTLLPSADRTLFNHTIPSHLHVPSGHHTPVPPHIAHTGLLPSPVIVRPSTGESDAFLPLFPAFPTSVRRTAPQPVDIGNAKYGLIRPREARINVGVRYLPSYIRSVKTSRGM